MKKSRVLPIALLALVSIGAITVEKSISSRITTRVYEVMPRATDVTASVPLFDLPGNKLLTSQGYKTYKLIDFPGH